LQKSWQDNSKSLINPFIGFTIIAIILGYVISKGTFITGGFLLILPFLIGFLALIFYDPKYGLFLCLNLSFIVNGIDRYTFVDFPFGLLIDFTLAITLVSAIFRKSLDQFGRANTALFYFWLMWAMFTLLGLLNPEAANTEAWLYAVRGLSLHAVLMISLILILLPNRRDFESFLKIWLLWSSIAALYGLKMHFMGLSEGEYRWLNNIGAVTHFIQGRIRIFSFYSDAGQYGAAMAQASLFAIILFLGKGKRKAKIIYLLIALLCFWSYSLSGSRGPIFIFIFGGFLYLILNKNFKIFFVGILLGAVIFGTIKYTYIGNKNYQIYRIRSAFNSDDPSFQVRLANQEKLKSYLETRPFGGGVGSAGDWGRRFYPGSFLSSVPVDSWFVRVWVETGIVGLVIHITILLAVLIIAIFKVLKLKDEELRTKMIAITCGYFGIVVASYGNQIFGQLPTSTVMYFSMSFLFMSSKFDSETLHTDDKLQDKPVVSQSKMPPIFP